jgi:branched-chain amino acid transport system permease protein
MRLSGSYLAVTTMGFAEVVRMVLLSWESVTNGAFGIQDIPRPSLFGYELTTANGGLYLLTLIAVIFTVYVCSAIDRSKVGRALRAIKNDELATTLMGVHVNACKVLAFTLAAAFAGLAGAIFAAMNRYIDPNTFNFDTSMLIVCICILGGMGSIKGQLLGAALLVTFPEILRAFALYRFVVYGVILILMMLFRPQGLLGGLSARPYRFPKGVARPAAAGEGGSGA